VADCGTYRHDEASPLRESECAAYLAAGCWWGADQHENVIGGEGLAGAGERVEYGCGVASPVCCCVAQSAACRRLGVGSCCFCGPRFLAGARLSHF
jgi:hypothetical protein